MPQMPSSSTTKSLVTLSLTPVAKTQGCTAAVDPTVAAAPSHSKQPSAAALLGYLTAEEEKSALKRCDNAKRAVVRVQNVEYYEQEPEAGILLDHQLSRSLPPPSEAGPPLTPPYQLSEKEDQN
ncbi:hypothetical protein M378DRAFT_14528 [Amanita muscaria Koide BX008]|uniref:Uncharacterized protein n=1 Tax=Amanita muscaria (strain Koide BX008) TaxID=946122 RepID=A0A0C2T0C8_AMAMK|nr:hypothetical protein M378DRAFT_14528 [Amanita muscaria Koide BX008]